MTPTRIARTIAGASLALALSLSALVPVARAQEPSSDDEEARGLFLAGQAAFDAARFEDALAYFRGAYERSPRAELLYNVAIAADRLRLDQEALDAFERFLALAAPDAPHRRDVEARAAVLRASLAARDLRAAEVATEEHAPDAVMVGALDAAPVASSSSDAAIAGWSLVGGGAAVAITGATLLGHGRAEAARVEGAAAGTPWTDVAGSAASAEWSSPAGIALSVIGATAVASGALWLALDGSREEPAIRVGLGLGGFCIGGTL